MAASSLTDRAGLRTVSPATRTLPARIRACARWRDSASPLFVTSTSSLVILVVHPGKRSPIHRPISAERPAGADAGVGGPALVVTHLRDALLLAPPPPWRRRSGPRLGELIPRHTTTESIRRRCRSPPRLAPRTECGPAALEASAPGRPACGPGPRRAGSGSRPGARPHGAGRRRRT